MIVKHGDCQEIKVYDPDSKFTKKSEKELEEEIIKNQDKESKKHMER